MKSFILISWIALCTPFVSLHSMEAAASQHPIAVATKQQSIESEENICASRAVGCYTQLYNTLQARKTRTNKNKELFEQALQTSARCVATNIISTISAIGAQQATQHILTKLGKVDGHIGVLSSLAALFIAGHATFITLDRLSGYSEKIRAGLAQFTLRLLPLKWYILHAPKLCLKSCMLHARKIYNECIFDAAGPLQDIIQLPQDEKNVITRSFEKIKKNDPWIAKTALTLMEARSLPADVMQCLQAKAKFENIKHTCAAQETNSNDFAEAQRLLIQFMSNQQDIIKPRSLLKPIYTNCLCWAGSIGAGYALGFHLTQPFVSPLIRAAVIAGCTVASKVTGAGLRSLPCWQRTPFFNRTRQLKDPQRAQTLAKETLEALQKTSQEERQLLRNRFELYPQTAYPALPNERIASKATVALIDRSMK